MKKIYQRILVLGLVSFMVFMSSCEKERFAPAPYVDPNDTTITPPDSISYSADMQPFWDAACINCHGGTIAPNLSTGVSYDAIINGGYIDATPASSLLYTKIAPGGSMEQYSTSANTSMTLQWIEEGALNN